MKIVCCICKKVLRAGPDDKVSHGHCDPCSTKFLWLNGLEQNELTDFIEAQNKKKGGDSEKVYNSLPG